MPRLRPKGYNSVQMRRRYFERLAYIESIKAQPCADCGGLFPPECMDFDHVTGEKFRGIAQMMSYRIERFNEELGKCEIVCANCHRIRTRKRNSVRDSSNGRRSGSDPENRGSNP